MSRFGIVEDGHELVVSEHDGEERTELHRLGREDEDLSASAPELALALRERLRALRAELGTAAPEAPRALTEEERTQLRALGYGGQAD